jgi:hypothetical protein
MNSVKVLVLGMFICGGSYLHADTSFDSGEIASKHEFNVQEWELRYFNPLSDQYKKLVIGTFKTVQGLLREVQRNIHKGADAFLSASSDLLNIYNQTMLVLLPSKQEIDRCFMLPCHVAYKASLDKYQKYEPLIAALDILPSIDLVWKNFEQFLPTDGNVTPEILKQGITKALRKGIIKKQIDQVLSNQIDILGKALAYIAQVYPDLVIEQQIEQEELEKTIKKALEVQSQDQAENN